MTSPSQPPHLTLNDRVATLTLRRPALANRLAPEDLATIREHIETVNAQERVAVLILKGEGKHFCSGYDIAEVARSSQIPGRGFGDMVDAVESCRAVTLAAIQGGVYGGATDMALACDFRIGCAQSEMFMPATRLGLHFYASGLTRFVTRLGPDTTRRLFLTAEKLNADAMRDCGFLTHFADGHVNEKAQELTDTLLSMAPIALLGVKRFINQIARGELDRAAIETEVQRSVQSTDIIEGAKAWREKRTPQFSGS